MDQRKVKQSTVVDRLRGFLGGAAGWGGRLVSGRARRRVLLAAAAAGALLLSYGLSMVLYPRSPSEGPPLFPPQGLQEEGAEPAAGSGPDGAAAGFSEPLLPQTPATGDTPGEAGAGEDDPEPPAPGDLVWPVAGRMSAGFGWVYSDTMADWRYHGGIDIIAGEEDPVRAVYHGRVTEVRYDGGWGWMVVVEHGPGTSSLYAGCARVLVEEGDRVSRGDTIAQVGSSALVESGEEAHLHFELYWDGERVDPLSILTGTGEN